MNGGSFSIQKTAQCQLMLSKSVHGADGQVKDARADTLRMTFLFGGAAANKNLRPTIQEREKFFRSFISSAADFTGRFPRAEKESSILFRYNRKACPPASETTGYVFMFGRRAGFRRTQARRRLAFPC